MAGRGRHFAFGEELRSFKSVDAAQQLPELQRDWALSPADSTDAMAFQQPCDRAFSARC